MRTQSNPFTTLALAIYLHLFLLLVSAPSVFAEGADEEWRALDQEAHRLMEAANYDRAFAAAVRAHELAKKKAGADHPDVATSLDTLGAIYHRQDQYDEAESFYLSALAMRKKARPSDQLGTLSSLENLAVLYRAMKRDEKAKEFDGLSAIFCKAADEALAKLAAEKRSAVVSLFVKGKTLAGDKGGQPHYGVFISGDGLALVGPGSLAKGTMPEVTVAGRKPLKMGAILGIFAEQEMVLVKFDHRPSSWLEIATKEPAIGEVVALVPLEYSNPWKSEILPVVGEIMSKPSGLTANLRITRFTKYLSLGSGLTLAQRKSLSPGCFSVDRKGCLVGFMGGIQIGMVSRQPRPRLKSIAHLAGRIRKLAEEGKDLGFPLPEELNPSNREVLDPDFRRMQMAVHGQEMDKWRIHLEKLLTRYPESRYLRRIAIEHMDFLDSRKLLAELGDFRPNPKDPPAVQVADHQARAMLLFSNEDFDGVLRELKAAIALSPKDYPQGRMMLGNLLMKLERFDEAETLFEEVYKTTPENIELLIQYRLLLIEQGKYDEAHRIAEERYKLSEIYR